jgi:hypothetical protein
MRTWTTACASFLACAAHAQITFIDATDAAGLGGLSSARVCLADLNSDGLPDAIIRDKAEGGAERYRIFINSPVGTFKELAIPTGLPIPRDGDCLVFADLDNDGAADAIFTRSLDINNEKFVPPADPPGTAWFRSHGDGTFGPPNLIPAAKPATTACIAVGDVDRDGLLDLWLGNWYTSYGQTNEAFTSDLLLQRRTATGEVSFIRQSLPEDAETFDEDRDAAGRPTYGVMIAPLTERGPSLLGLSYGRRWNRLWTPSPDTAGGTAWTDLAPSLGLDGDPIRHGKYPPWLKERAKTDPRFDRPDEKPFRSNGNSFDASIADIDRDGDFDLFITEITHAWAGESSDRSRFLVNSAGRFDSPEALSVDRIPPTPPPDQWAALGTPEAPYLPRWNQGDLFCQLADLDLDGRIDLIISSGDYPDPPPFDQRLRVYLQRPDGTFADATSESGIDHAGSQQLSLGDVDLDGDLDILVGQTFNRLSAEDVRSRGLGGPDGLPRVRLFLNQAAQRGTGSSLSLKLAGDPARGTSRDALGAIVRMTADLDGDGPDRPVTQAAMLIGIGGHAGKQMEFAIHFGIGLAAQADSVVIEWPTADALTTTVGPLPPGRHTVSPNGPMPPTPR